MQTTGFVPTHAPDWHVSVCVQASPSLQAVPSAFGVGSEQRPVAVSHVPGSWHGSAVQTTGFEPVHTPASQWSVCVQALPSSQAAPFVFAGFEQIPVAVSHVPAS